ncbi:MAG TPA: amidohydrolase family protein [Bryobacteraceae bacterium]|nr:amidohydrolase family protein [Bryobacteraceae bacterium]
MAIAEVQSHTNPLEFLLAAGRVMVLAVTMGLVVRAASPLFDLHVHLRNGEESLRTYEAQVKEARLHVEGMGAMWFGGPNQALTGRPTQTRAANDGIIALAAKHPNILPIVTVHPYDGRGAVSELERVAAKGIKVLKLHPHTQKFDLVDPRVLTLVRRSGELGVIAMIDNANILPGDSEKLFNLALMAPKTKFIFAHMGAMNFRFWNILKAARTAQGLFGDNIYFDISAIVVLVADSPIEDEFVWTMRNVGIDHVLLGSDYPQYSLEQNVNALGRLALDESERARICYENARALFGLR